MKMLRPDGRKGDQLRPVSFKIGVAPNCMGSALIRMGNTQVICGVSIENERPRWMKEKRETGGWITAEYSLLPYSTPDRARREATAGRLSGRTQEIQRLIGRAMRAAVDLDVLGERTIWVDCDVLQADGGTRTAAITGSFVALRLAVHRLLRSKEIAKDPVCRAVAAVSVGLVHGRPRLDLCYEEDLAASVDMNLVMTDAGEFVEVQGTAEGNPYSRAELNALLTIGEKGIRELLAIQKKAAARR